MQVWRHRAVEMRVDGGVAVEHRARGVELTLRGGGKPSATVVHTVTLGGSYSSATTTSAATMTSGATTTSPGGGGGNSAAGKSVFASGGCASCHTFKPANATGTIGPDLDSAPATDAKARLHPLRREELTPQA